MTNESIRAHCLSLPHATEVVQWEDHLLFKVGGKMFAILELDGHSCGFRCTPDTYADLVERSDIVPASHNMWKYHWVTTETLTALPEREFISLLNSSYSIVRGTLPRKVQAALAAGEGAPAPARAPKRGARTREATGSRGLSSRGGRR